MNKKGIKNITLLGHIEGKSDRIRQRNIYLTNLRGNSHQDYLKTVAFKVDRIWKLSIGQLRPRCGIIPHFCSDLALRGNWPCQEEVISGVVLRSPKFLQRLYRWSVYIFILDLEFHLLILDLEFQLLTLILKFNLLTLDLGRTCSLQIWNFICSLQIQNFSFSLQIWRELALNR